MKYNIAGGELPVLNIVLDKDETLVTESGGMCWMDTNMIMETKASSFQKAIGRVFSGETMFLNYYTAKEDESRISVSSSFPGSIIPIEIDEGKEFVAQSGLFLPQSWMLNCPCFFVKK